MSNTMGIDQYGKTYHGLGRYPRKALLKKLGYRKASKMYIDTTNGESKHVGYVVGGLWVTIYRIEEWTGRHA